MWLLTVDLNVGGAERHMVELAKHWPDASVVIVALAGSRSEPGTIFRGLEVISLTERRPTARWAQIIWFVAVLRRLAGRFRCDRPDIVVAFLAFTALASAMALNVLPSPRPRFLWSVQSDLLRNYGVGAKRFVLWLIRRCAFPKVSLFVTPSAGIRNKLIQIGVTPGQIELIPNAIPPTRSSGGCVPKRTQKYRIVSIGRCVAEKGWRELLEAVAGMQEPDVELCLVGEGPERRKLSLHARQLGIEGRVLFAGVTSDPISWLESADIFVSSSWWETFGLAIAEAMAVGLPVVATATDGASALIESGQSGVLVPLGDVRRMALALDELCHDAVLRNVLGIRAKTRVEKCSPEDVANAYARAASRIAGQRKTRLRE